MVQEKENRISRDADSDERRVSMYVRLVTRRVVEMSGESESLNEERKDEGKRNR